VPGLFDLLADLTAKDLEKLAKQFGITPNNVGAIVRDPERARRMLEKVLNEGEALLQDLSSSLIMTAGEYIRDRLRLSDPQRWRDAWLEHEGAEEEDPYQVLKVSATSTPAFVERVYRGRVLIAHPDRGGSTEELIRVTRAMERIRAEWRRNGRSRK